jgi:hypothetical protein
MSWFTLDYKQRKKKVLIFILLDARDKIQDGEHFPWKEKEIFHLFK